MWLVAQQFQVRFGGNTYIDTPNLVVFKDAPVVTLRRHDDNGYLGIDFDINDESGKRVATVRRNEIYRGDKEKYDLVQTADQYTLTEKASGRVLCDIKRKDASAPDELDVSVRLYMPNGFLLDATPTGTNVGGMQITGCTFSNCGAGIGLG